MKFGFVIIILKNQNFAKSRKVRGGEPPASAIFDNLSLKHSIFGMFQLKFSLKI